MLKHSNPMIGSRYSKTEVMFKMVAWCVEFLCGNFRNLAVTVRKGFSPQTF